MFSIAEAPVAASLVVRLASIITTELLLGYVAPRGLANNCPVHNGNNHNMGGVMGRGVKRVHSENIGSQDNVVMIMMQEAH